MDNFFLGKTKSQKTFGKKIVLRVPFFRFLFFFSGLTLFCDFQNPYHLCFEMKYFSNGAFFSKRAKKNRQKTKKRHH
jgi:hypothetical protein